MLELLAAWGSKSLADVRNHYDEARADMLHTIRSTHRELVGVFERLVERHKDIAFQLAVRFADMRRQAKADGVEIVPAQRNVIQKAPSFSNDRIAGKRKKRLT
jgi:hypothetical protein